MIVEGFQFDVPGKEATVSLGGLGPGLNLVLGPRGCGKSTAHAMLSQAVFGGAVPRSSQDSVRLWIHDDEGIAKKDLSRSGAARHLSSLDTQQLAQLEPWHSLEFDGQSQSPPLDQPDAIETALRNVPESQQACEYCHVDHHGQSDFWHCASTYLRGITEDHLVSLRRSPARGTLEMRTGRGELACFHCLTPAGRDMLRISLSLALANHNRRLGIQLPILLDEPFQHLDARETHLLTHVLHDTAKAGQQIVVFTQRAISIESRNLPDVAVHQLGTQDASCPTTCHCQCHRAVPAAGLLENKPALADAEPWLCVFTGDDSPYDTAAAEQTHRSNPTALHATAVLPLRSDASDAQAWEEADDLIEHSRSLRRNSDRSAGLPTIPIADAEVAGNESLKVLSQTESRPGRASASGRSGRRGTNRSDSHRRSRRRRSTQDESPISDSAQRDSRREVRTGRERIAHDNQDSIDEPAKSQQGPGGRHEKQLRFYLNPADPVVDAPEIGPKMAERLQAVGIHTIEDLLAADADQVVERMNHKRTNADKVRRWQRQSRLMCRVPRLRGHDAQILVACDVTQPEQLAAKDPQELLGLVGPFAETKEGVRILRGGQQPDLDEVTDWISWAASSRSLDAA